MKTDIKSKLFEYTLVIIIGAIVASGYDVIKNFIERPHDTINLIAILFALLAVIALILAGYIILRFFFKDKGS
jgi:hypothetical protein